MIITVHKRILPENICHRMSCAVLATNQCVHSITYRSIRPCTGIIVQAGSISQTLRRGSESVSICPLTVDSRSIRAGEIVKAVPFTQTTLREIYQDQTHPLQVFRQAVAILENQESFTVVLPLAFPAVEGFPSYGVIVRQYFEGFSVITSTCHCLYVQAFGLGLG